MNGALEWFAALGAIIAAGVIAADLGRRWTGGAFVLFAAVSVAWVIAGVSSKTMPLIIQNGILLAVNLFGVWQYLINPRKKREIDRAERLAEQAHEELSAKTAASSTASA